MNIDWGLVLFEASIFGTIGLLTLAFWLLHQGLLAIIGLPKGWFEMGVKCCARCGEDHKKVLFQTFSRNVDGLDATHWGTCPTNSEPILMTVMDDGKDS